MMIGHPYIRNPAGKYRKYEKPSYTFANESYTNRGSGARSYV